MQHLIARCVSPKYAPLFYLGVEKMAKKSNKILVEITSEQARTLFVYSDENEIFLLHDDNSESLLGENNYNDYETSFWNENRFAIEAKTIPEVKKNESAH